MYYIVNFCIICLKNNDLRDLTEVDSNGMTLEKLEYCFEDMISKDLPLYICNFCYEQLKKSYDLKKAYVKSKYLLQTFVKKLQTSKYDKRSKLEVFLKYPKCKHENENLAQSDESDNAAEEYEYMHLYYATSVEEKEALDIKDNILETVDEDKIKLAHLTNFTTKTVVENKNTKEPSIEAKVQRAEQINLLLDTKLKHTENVQSESEALENKMSDCINNRTGEAENNNDFYVDVSFVENQESDNIDEDFREMKGKHAKTKQAHHYPLKSETCSISSKLRDRSLRKYPKRPEKDVEIEKKLAQCVKDERCQHCDKQFSEIKCLKKHMTQHNIDRPFRCNQCGRAFREKSHLKEHLITHSGVKPFSCKECHRRFTRKSQLTRHMSCVHTNVKPFSCSLCQKQFVLNSYLKRHMLYHGSTRPFSCSQCHKQYTQRCGLKRHMVIHTGERPYSCSQCGMQFREKGHLKSHMVTHNKDRPYKCDKCSKHFKRSSDLQKHVALHTKLALFKQTEEDQS